MLMDSSNSLSIFGSAAVLIAVIAPAILRTPAVETPKGQDSTVAIVSEASAHGVLQRVEAKLWEDPFEAIGVAEQQRRKERRELKDIGESSARTDTTSKPPGQDSISPNDCVKDEYAIGIACLRAEISRSLDPEQIRRTQSAIHEECDFVVEQANRAMDKRVHKPKCDLNAPSLSVVQLLLIPVHSGRSFDAVESRRQARVALQTAMLSRDWAARRETHMGALRWSPRRDAHTSIPFELFQHASGAVAVVLWLDETQYQDAQQMKGLVEELTTGAALATKRKTRKPGATEVDSPGAPAMPVCAAGAPCDRGVAVSIIGPTGTDSLIAMLESAQRAKDNKNGKEAREEKKNKTPPLVDRTAVGARPLPTHWARIYSPVSSVDETAIFDTPTLRWRAPPRESTDEEVSCPVNPEIRLGCEFSSTGLVYTRGVMKDEQVMGAILKEIQQRRKAVRPRECTVLIVSEGDSLYARALTAQIGHQLHGDGPANRGDCKLLQVPGREAAGAYQYLKSINDPRASGELDERQKARAAANPSGSRGDTLIAGQRDAISEGNQQFDYIRRLARRIVGDAGANRLDTERVFAVGVFGTDPHDKVSILKVLKPALPHARFFTTDLDAVLYDADHVTWTRNLIVGSAFGLESGGSARGMPPFRRMRQTAYVGAISAALGGGAVLAPDAKPHLYEIGLAGPIRLGEHLEVCAVGTSISERWRTVSWSYRVGAIALLGLVVVVLAGFVGKRLWRLVVNYVDLPARKRSTVEGSFERSGIAMRATLCGLAIASTIVWWGVAAVSLAESCGGSGEPLALFEGASLWVPTVVRGAAITLGIVAMLSFLGCSRRTIRSVGLERGLFRRANGRSPAGRTDLIRDYLGFTPKTGTRNKLRLWLAFTRHTCFSGFAAVAGGCALFFLYLGLLAFVHDPNIPSRGPWMTFLSELSIWLSGTVAFSLAAASWLQTEAMRTLVHDSIPGDPEPCDTPAPTRALQRGDEGPVVDDPLLHPPEYRDRMLAEWGLPALPPLDEMPGTRPDRPGDTSLRSDKTRHRIDSVLILEMTERLARPAQVFVYMPLIMTSLLILARWRLFENQTFPPALWITFGTLVALSLWNAWRLSTLASQTHVRMRRDIANDLRAVRQRLAVAEDAEPKGRLEAEIRLLNTLDERLEQLNTGIFAPLLAQPFFKALLLPLGTGSVLEWVAVAKGFG